jgi:predicted dehydrogenase
MGGPKGKIKMKTTVTWGMIGAGDVCERKSGPPLYQVPRSALGSVYRRDTAAAQAFVERHGHGHAARSYQEMLADPIIDAVYVATPHHLHAEHTIAALEAGKHVLVEKPMALSTEECDAMVSAAAEAERALGVAYYRRGYPSVALAAQMIRDGALGTPLRMAINAEFPTSHRIDLVHHLLGPIETVERDVLPANAGYRFEQMMPRIRAHSSAGTTTTLMEQWTETGMPEAFVIEGADATLNVYDLKGGVAALTTHATDTVEMRYPGTLPWTHWGLVENFVAHLLDGTPLMCDGTAGRASTVVLESIDAAGKTAGAPVAVRY